MKDDLIVKIDDNLYERYLNCCNWDTIEEAFEDTCGEYVSNDIIKDIYNKEDIQKILKCESAKALRFLKFMFGIGYAVKIGRNYYVKCEDFERFFNDYKGREVAL